MRLISQDIRSNNHLIIPPSLNVVQDTPLSRSNNFSNLNFIFKENCKNLENKHFILERLIQSWFCSKSKIY